MLNIYDPKRGAGPLKGLPTHAEKEARARVVSQRMEVDVPPPSVVAPRKRNKRVVLRQGLRCGRINTSYVAGAVSLLATITRDGWKALTVLRSGLVPPEVSTYRDAICRACPHATKTQIKKKKKKIVVHFCNCCSCGTWTSTEDGAEIESKNTHARNMCPEDPPRFGEYAGEPVTKKRSLIRLIPTLVRAASSALIHGGSAIRNDLRVHNRSQ